MVCNRITMTDWLDTLTRYDTLVPAASFLLGALLGAGVVWNQLRHRHHRQVNELTTTAAQTNIQLQTCIRTVDQLQEEQRQLRQAAQTHQEEIGGLNMAMARLQQQTEQIPLKDREIDRLQVRIEQLQQELRQETAALAQAQEKNRVLERLESLVAEKDQQVDSLKQLTARQGADIAERDTLIAQERKQTEEKIRLLNDAKTQLTAEFKNLANTIFEEKSRLFSQQNRVSMDQLLHPLRDQLGEFKKRVEDVYDKETRDRVSLAQEISHLKSLNQRISRDAINLTRALTGDSKKRGSWGEVILERVLEESGLCVGREYDLQVSLTNDQGRRSQPDAVVHLPNERDVIIDAKVSLTAYERYHSAEDEPLRQRAFKAHVDAMRTHVQQLSAKRYEALEGVRSLDFVLMFVPIESAFLTAMEHERSLFTEAFDKNIIIVSPATLMVTLRTIHNVWRNAYQNRHAAEIARQAGALYDKFVGFVESLEEVGKQLDRARQAYHNARDRLSTGRGNLLRRTQNLIDLGIKARKQLPTTITLNEADPGPGHSNPDSKA